jgi:hypothetical protein
VAEINEQPVYTIHELLEGRRITPSKVYLMGGPSQALRMDVFKAFKLSVTVPENAAVANAVGAALTRTTHDVHLFADTQRGRLVIPSLGYSARIDRDYDLHQARADAAARLGEHLQAIQADAGPEDVEVTEATSFNMVAGLGSVGKNIRVKAQVKPGVTQRINQG